MLSTSQGGGLSPPPPTHALKMQDTSGFHEIEFKHAFGGLNHGVVSPFEEKE